MLHNRTGTLNNGGKYKFEGESMSNQFMNMVSSNKNKIRATKFVPQDSLISSCTPAIKINLRSHNYKEFERAKEEKELLNLSKKCHIARA